EPVLDGSFDEKKLMHDLRHYLPAQASLKDFVHHNSLHAYQDKEFFEAIFSASKTFGIQVTFNLDEYRQLYRQGRISEQILDRVIIENKGIDQWGRYLHKMLEHPLKQNYTHRIGRLRAQWKEQYHLNLDDRVHPRLFRMVGAYLDQGIAIDHFPNTDKGLIDAIRSLEKLSFVSFFQTKRAKELLHDPDLTLEQLLTIVVGHEAYFSQYVFDQQFAHKGWSGMIASIERTPDTLLYQKAIKLEEFIILELLLEIDVLDKELGRKWNGLALGYAEEAMDYFAPVETGEIEEVLKLWQLAFEWQYYDEVIGALSYVASKKPLEEKVEKSFQALFCIDDREGSIRRHFEYVAPDCETIGVPGFFGTSIYFQALGSQFYEKQCPVPVTPKHLIKEVARKKKHGKEHFQTRYSHTVVRGFFLSLSLGGQAVIRFLLDLFRPTMRADIADAYSHMDIHGELQIEAESPPQMENGLQVGYTVEEMADVVYSLLITHSLTENLTDLVYVIAHGSSSANNPHHGAYDCGACSGRPGGVNARVFAYMVNHQGVRKKLAQRGLILEDRTHFLGAMHDTSSDEIRYYDRSKLSDWHYQKHQEYLKLIEKALDLNALERSRRFASIDMAKPLHHVHQQIKDRSVSYFEPRPELGHGTNALCYVGSRPRVSKLFLDRRAFHQTYCYKKDPDGSILKQILGPLPVVCGGINLEYFFSRMDKEKMGAGTKLPFHVMGLFGVTTSADGDLRPGLPLQMVETHDPMRLLMIIEQEPEMILKVVQSTPAIYEWFLKGWIHLVALSPRDSKVYRFSEGDFYPYQSLAGVNHSSDIIETITKGPKMTSNYILDATKENLPVHIIK
ncbi:MAG: DUF2309 domain-containing protein, partial [Bacteroidetes bacterium]|nr:DUF2309 domain-containing protein [Bacteroidota bacterium]